MNSDKLDANEIGSKTRGFLVKNELRTYIEALRDKVSQCSDSLADKQYILSELNRALGGSEIDAIDIIRQLEYKMDNLFKAMRLSIGKN